MAGATHGAALALPAAGDEGRWGPRQREASGGSDSPVTIRAKNRPCTTETALPNKALLSRSLKRNGAVCVAEFEEKRCVGATRRR